MTKKIDVILPVWNARRYVELCVNALIEKTKDFNLIIVDNGSLDETRNWLMQFAMDRDNVHLIRKEKNLGYVGGVNEGVKYSREVTQSPFIAVVTSDTITSSGWAEKMGAFFSDPTVAMVGPVSNAVAGRQSVVFQNSKYNHEVVDYLIGLFYIIRADVVDQLVCLDGFYLDELFNYGSSDDLDLSFRIRKLGYSLLIDRATYIHHFMSISLSKLAEEQGRTLESLHGEFLKLFLKKHKIQSLSNQREPYVLIGIPSISEKWDYRFCMSTWMQNMNFKHYFAPPMIRMMPDMARNKLAQLALDYGCTHLLVIDDDSCWDDQNLFIKLLAHDKDIVGIKAFTRNPPHMPCTFYETDRGFFQEVDFDCVGLREVGGLGMAATLIKTEVFRKMPEPWFEFRNIKILGKGNDRFGEDLNFCKKARELGFGVWCDTDIETAHVGDNVIVTRKNYHAATGKKQASN